MKMYELIIWFEINDGKWARKTIGLLSNNRLGTKILKDIRKYYNDNSRIRFTLKTSTKTIAEFTDEVKYRIREQVTSLQLFRQLKDHFDVSNESNKVIMEARQLFKEVKRTRLASTSRKNEPN